MTVRIYNSTDANAPILIGTAPGGLITVLDACLINGYPGKASSGWSKPFASGNSAVYRTGAGNQRYLMVDDSHFWYAAVVGFETMTGVNIGTGQFPTRNLLSPILGSQWITFATPIISGGSTGLVAGTTYTATVVIDGVRTIVISALGSAMTTWAQLIAVIQAAVSAGSLSIGTATLNNGAIVLGSSSAGGSTTGSSIVLTNTGANPLFSSLTNTATLGPSSSFPRGLFLNKVTPGGSIINSVPWTIVATESAIWMWVNMGQEVGLFPSAGLYFFGDIVSFKPGDLFNTMIIGSTSSSPSGNGASLVSTNFSSVTSGHFIARSYTQLGSAYQVGKHTDLLRNNTGALGRGSVMFPNPTDGGISISPIWVQESAISGMPIRGILPGIWSINHLTAFQHGDTFTGSGTTAGKTFTVFNIHNSGGTGQCALETSDTW